MTIKKESIELFHEHGIYQPTRTFELTGEVDQSMYLECMKNLHSLDKTDGPINIVLNSEGGCVTNGMAIFDMIKGCRNYVRIFVCGEASSMGSVILQAADERVISTNSLVMIHMGEHTVSGHPQTTKNWSAYFEKLDKVTEEIYLEKIKQKKPRYRRGDLKKLLTFDTILPAVDALALGLVDRIGEFNEI